MLTADGKDRRIPRSGICRFGQQVFAFERDRLDFWTEGRMASSFPSAKQCSSGVRTFTPDHDGVLDHVCL